MDILQNAGSSQQDCSNKSVKEHVHSSYAEHIQINFKN